MRRKGYRRWGQESEEEEKVLSISEMTDRKEDWWNE